MSENRTSPGTAANPPKDQPTRRGQDRREATQENSLDASDKEQSDSAPPSSGLPGFLWEAPADANLNEVARMYRAWKRGETVDDGGGE